MERINVLGSKMTVASRQQAQQIILENAVKAKPGYVCVANVHTTMMGFFDTSYRHITNQSLLSVPDGVPLVWAMNSFGAHGQDRVRGPTLMRDLCALGLPLGLKHYLFGGSAEALEKLKRILETEYPGISIVGAESPPFRPLDSISSEEWEASAKKINQSGAQILWVGLGAPKQEAWMFRQRDSINCVMLGVGAAFDLLSGTIEEAPHWMQRLGLEWTYRLWMEPKRLWRRYVLNNPLFLILWVCQLLGFKKFD